MRFKVMEKNYPGAVYEFRGKITPFQEDNSIGFVPEGGGKITPFQEDNSIGYWLI